MIAQLIHNSRSALYRTPQGAGTCGSRVRLRIRVADVRPERVALRLWWNDAEQQVDMRPSELAGGLYECDYQLPQTPGLLWYFFIVEWQGHRLYYGNAHDQLGGIGATYSYEPPSYQLTVAHAHFDAPHWMREGILYQIMPDRFYRAGALDERRLPPGGVAHADWHEPPYLAVDERTQDNQANDFYGGNLEGIRQKLPYLKRLGVTAIYLNPIFRASTNHRYNTGDYKAVDPLLGDEAAFVRLCREAGEMGLRVVLDGVFSHTGEDSVYFNKYGRYPGPGAYQSKESPYFEWYTFRRWPDDYVSWWGFDTLPEVNELEASYLRYMIRDRDAVAARWLARGACGWRLDVADELPMPFLRELRRRVKLEDPEALVLGEVWEDASNKVAYGQLRSYCLGDTLDSVMNYPLRDGLLAFMTGRLGASQLKRRLDSLEENYPKPFFYSLMNLLGSHDRARALNVLGGLEGEELPRTQRREARLTPGQYALAKRRYLALWQFVCALPGTPCLYYGDEAGAQGMADPFCRGTYPWGREDQELLAAVAAINRERLNSPALKTGAIRLMSRGEDVLIAARWVEGGRDVFGRPAPDERRLCLINRSDRAQAVELERGDWAQLEEPMRVELAPCSARLMTL